MTSNFLLKRLIKLHNAICSILDKTVSKLKETDIFVFPNSLKEQEGIIEEQTILGKVDQECHSNNIMRFLGDNEQNLIIKSHFSEGPQDCFFYII